MQQALRAERDEAIVAMGRIASGAQSTEARLVRALADAERALFQAQSERDEARAALEAIRLEVCCPEGGDLQEHVTRLVEKVATGALRQTATLAQAQRDRGDVKVDLEAEIFAHRLCREALTQARQRIKELEAARSEALAVAAKRISALPAEQLEPEE